MKRKPMTIKEWKAKHPRCKYCVHLHYPTLQAIHMGDDRAWCGAKMKNVNDETPRYFCRLYETKEE